MMFILRVLILSLFCKRVFSHKRVIYKIVSFNFQSSEAIDPRDGVNTIPSENSQVSSLDSLFIHNFF